MRSVLIKVSCLVVLCVVSVAYAEKPAKGKGKRNFCEFLADREEILPWINEYSPYGLATKGDSPVYMIFKNAPAMGEAQKDPTQTALEDVKQKTAADYLIETLKQGAAK